MMTLMGRLCGLCAVCALSEWVLGDSDARGSMRMIGGLLMLQLTLRGAGQLLERMLTADGLTAMLESLIA